MLIAARPDLGQLVHVHQGRRARTDSRDADSRAAGARCDHSRNRRTAARRAAHGARRDPRVLAGTRGRRPAEHRRPVLAAFVGRDADRLGDCVDHPGVGAHLQRTARVRVLLRAARHGPAARRRRSRLRRRRAARRRPARGKDPRRARRSRHGDLLRHRWIAHSPVPRRDATAGDRARHVGDRCFRGRAVRRDSGARPHAGVEDDRVGRRTRRDRYRSGVPPLLHDHRRRRRSVRRARHVPRAARGSRLRGLLPRRERRGCRARRSRADLRRCRARYPEESSGRSERRWRPVSLHLRPSRDRASTCHGRRCRLARRALLGRRDGTVPRRPQPAGRGDDRRTRSSAR